MNKNREFRETDFKEISSYYEENKEYYMNLLYVIAQHPEFVAVKGLKSYKGVPGEYFIAIENTHKFCIGKAANLESEILTNWKNTHPNEDLFSHCRVFIHPADIRSELTNFGDISDKFLIEDFSEVSFGGENNMNTDKIDMIKGNLEKIDKRKVAMTTGGILALVGALTILKKVFKSHE